MKKYLLISEKPSLMRLVKNAYFKANMPFDVDFIALHGHCCTLCQPEDYDEKYKKWTRSDLPIIPEVYRHTPVEKDLVDEIAGMINENNYDGLINCTDAEREGQNIFYSLYDYLGCSLPVKRFWASDLTDSKLIEAWKNLRDDQKDPFLSRLTEASLLRADMDWLIGMNFSRALTLASNRPIPVGRVMTVVLAILAKREEEIRNYKAEKTYNLVADYKEGFSGEYVHEPFAKKEDAEKELAKAGNTFNVTEFKKSERTIEAPLLYSLGELQNDANKEYGYTLSSSLAIIQSLYEAKILSYPRTDSPYLTTGEAKRMPEILKACMMVEGMDGYRDLIDNSRVDGYTKTKYVNDSKVQAHYAIIMTGTGFDWNLLKKEQQNILKLVAKRIIATLMAPAKGQDIHLKAETNGMVFETSENIITEVGWKKLYGEKTASSSISDIAKGSVLHSDKVRVKETVSKIPSRFNDASINRAMINVGTLIEDKELAKALNGKTKDQGGIGTPATRAGIVEKLLDAKKGWVERKNKQFYVSDEGLSIYHIVQDLNVASPVLTAQWETKLKNVEDGKMNGTDLTEELNAFVREEVARLFETKQAETLRCPVCGSPIKESAKYFICSKYKESCEFAIPKDLGSDRFTADDLKKLSEGKETAVKNFVSKSGKKFRAAIVIRDGRVAYNFDNGTVDETIICQCGKNPKKLDGKFGTYYKCECGRIVNEKYFGRKFSKNEIKKLFKGDKVRADGLKSKSGKEFSAELAVNENKVSIVSFCSSDRK